MKYLVLCLLVACGCGESVSPAGYAEAVRVCEANGGLAWVMQRNYEKHLRLDIVCMNRIEIMARLAIK